MKRILSLALAALVLLGTSGCTKEYYTINQGTELQWVDFNVGQNQWVLNAEDGCYSIQLNVPQITKSIVENGAVQVARKELDGNIVIWTPLPISRAVGSYTTEDGHLVFYSRYIDYEWQEGKVFVYVTCTDFVTEDVPEAMSFRVNILRN